MRSAATRLRLIRATIDCLHELGFAATTTVAVAARAEASRGAMLHQFATRTELLLATAEYIVADQDRRRRETLRDVPRGAERFAAITDVVWATMKEPASIALLEILLGARSDPDLSVQLPTLLETLRVKLTAGPTEVARDIGISRLDLVSAMSTLHLAAMRGLAIERLLTPDSPHVDDAYALLGWYKQQLTIRLLHENNTNSLD